jgi:hypothetical protein
MDLHRITPGDAVVVELDSLSDSRNIGYAKRDGVSLTIKEPTTSAGEWIHVEILEVDREVQSIVAAPGDRPGLDNRYQHGDVLTVSVDDVRNDSAVVDTEPGRTLEITNYPHYDRDIEVKVQSVERDFMRCRRFFCINGPSRTSLLETNHDYPCWFEFADDLIPDELNVFVSRLLASDERSLLKRVFEQFSSTDSVELTMMTELLEQMDNVTPTLWRHILCTMIDRIPHLTANVGADYLGAVLTHDEIPEAWRASVLGNTAILLDLQDVDIKYDSIDIHPEAHRDATVSDQALYI